MLRPAADDKLRMWPVSRRVNKTGTGDDDPAIIDEVAALSIRTAGHVMNGATRRMST